jgi:hypothetical protein
MQTLSLQTSRKADGGLVVSQDVESALERRVAATAQPATATGRAGRARPGALGRLQAIWFCEFEGPRSRSVHVSVV